MRVTSTSPTGSKDMIVVSGENIYPREIEPDLRDARGADVASRVPDDR